MRQGFFSWRDGVVDPEDRIASVKEWSNIRDDETERLKLTEEYADWCWRSR